MCKKKPESNRHHKPRWKVKRNVQCGPHTADFDAKYIESLYMGQVFLYDKEILL